MKMFQVDPELARQKILKTYEQGRWRFALLRGALGWGIPMFIFFIVDSFFIPGMRHITTPLSLAFTAAICAFFGFLWGLSMWRKLIARPAKILLQAD